MLSGFIKWAVKSYFDEFLEDVDCNQLSLGLLRGHVELTDLTICKKGRIFSKALPIFIDYGHVDSFVLKAPLKLFRDESWFLSLTNVSINCSCKPVQSKFELLQGHRKDALSRKFTELARLEDSWKVESLGYAKIPWAELATSLLFQIIRNISLTVTKFQCKILIDSEESVLVQAESISVEQDSSASSRCQKIVHAIGLQISLQNASTPSFNFCGPINISASADITSDDESPLNFSWHIDSPITISVSPLSCEILSDLITDVGALSEVFRLREDALLCPVTSHAKLWWQHAFWLVSTSLRNFSRFRFQKRLAQTTVYSKAYKQWLKFDYVEIDLKKPREDIEISWPVDLLINLRRVVLDRYLHETKRLPEKELPVSLPKSPETTTPRSTSHSWLSSVGSWVGLGRSNSQPDFQIEPAVQIEQVDILPTEAPQTAEEAKKLQEKIITINGMFSAIIFAFGVDGNLQFRFQNVNLKSETSSFNLSVNSADLLLDETAVFAANKDDCLSVSFAKEKIAEPSTVHAAISSPAFNISTTQTASIATLICEYPFAKVKSFTAGLAQLTDKHSQVVQETQHLFLYDVRIISPSMRLCFTEEIGLTVAANDVILKSANETLIDSFDQNSEENCRELPSPCCSVNISSMIVSSFDAVKLILLNDTVCNVTRSPSNLAIDVSLPKSKMVVCPQMVELGLRIADFARNLAVSTRNALKTYSHLETAPARISRNCLRLNLLQAVLTLENEVGHDLFDFTISDVEIMADSSSSSKLQLAIGAFLLNKPSIDLYKNVYLKGSSNDQDSSFLSFEADLTWEDEIESKVLSLTIADVEFKSNPQFLAAISKFGKDLLKKLPLPKVEGSNHSKQNFELIASLAGFSFTLLPQYHAPQCARLLMKDFQALCSTSSSWEVAFDFINFTWEDNETANTVIASHSDTDSCFRLKLDSVEGLLAINTISLDVFLPPAPLVWLASNYLYLISKPKSNMDEEQEEKEKDVKQLVREINYTSEKSRLRLECDCEVSVSEITHRIGEPNVVFSKLTLKKSSVGVSLLYASNFTLSTLTRDDEVGRVSLVKIKSERVFRLSWSVLAENLVKDLVAVYAKMGSQLGKILKPDTGLQKQPGSRLEVDLSSRSFDIALLDPFDPKKEVVHCLLQSPSILFISPDENERPNKGWECNVDAHLVRLTDCLTDVVALEVSSSLDKAGSRSSIPLSLSYPGISSGSSITVNTNYLLKPLPPVPDFSLAQSPAVPLFRLKITSEDLEDGSTRREISTIVENHCSLALTEKCLPTLLESVGLGAKMFPVITTKDQFGRPMHKLQTQIAPSPDALEFTFTANSLNCRILSGDTKSAFCFASASVTDGVSLSFSSVPNVHQLNGIFSANSIQLYDESREFGSLYSCRAMASGLKVEFSKAGLPDYELKLFKHDVLAEIKADSISYVHTKRIIVSIFDFIDHLVQHRELLGKKTAQIQQIPAQELPGHGARLDLRFALQNANLIVPTSYSSEKSIVIRCGQTVYGTSGFAWQGEKETNLCKKREESSLPTLHPKLVTLKLHEPSASDGSSIFSCLLNSLRFDLKGLSVFDGTWRPTLSMSDGSDLNLYYIDFSMYSIEVDKATAWSQVPIPLLVHVERNLDGGLSRNAPDFSVCILFDSLDLDISREQASRIFGVLDKNLGEDLGGPVPPSLPDNMTSYKQIEVALYAQGCHVNLHDDDRHQLARVRLCPAALSFSRFSNNWRTIDFKWPEVHITDIRGAPATIPYVAALPVGENLSDHMQFELNYSANDNGVRMGFLLSHVHANIRDDFWPQVIKFITTLIQEGQQQSATVSNSPVPIYDDDSSGDGETKAIFAVGEEVIVTKSPPPTLQQQPRRVSMSFNVSLHRSEFSLLTLLAPGNSNSQRFGFLAEISAILAMKPTKALTLNIPSFKVSKLTSENKPSDVVAMMTNFIADISHENGLTAESPISLVSPDNKSVVNFDFNTPQLPPSSDMRCEILLGSLRIDANPQLIRLLNLLTTQPQQETTAPSSTEVVVKTESKTLLSRLTQVYPELTKIKLSVSLVACNLTIDSTPVVTVTLSDLAFEQSLFADLPGSFILKLACRYHNAAVSNWEPLVETWSNQLAWRYDCSSQPGENTCFQLSSTSEKVLNINVTSAVLELVKWLKQNWNISESLQTSLPDVAATSSDAKHSARPCILVNKLELSLYFTVQQSDYWSSIDAAGISKPPILLANPNQEIEFGENFSPSCSLSLAVKIAGHQAISLPVPVDATGIVVRSTLPEAAPKGGKAARSSLVNPTRIIFRVTLNRRRQKVIYAESAVRLINRLPHGLALTFTDSSDDDPSQSNAVVTLDTGESVPLPVANLYKHLWFRPLKPGIGFCLNSVIWQNVTQPGLPENSPVSCQLSRPDSRPYYCIVSVVKRQSHFSDISVSNTDPWHAITISPPIIIRNLLPCDMTFDLSVSSGSRNGMLNASDRLQSGRTARLTAIDSDSANLSLSVKLDQYPYCTAVSVMIGRSNLFVLDETKRPLRLTMTAERSRHGVLVIRIECSYWLYNNTNLPIVFRQHSNSLPSMDTTPFNLRNSTTVSMSSDDEAGHNVIAAGQSPEFEVARSVVPLMFSFDDEEWQFCQMRLGKGLHYPALMPIWSQKFSLVGGTTTRWLFASSSEENYVPERCYVIGLEVEQGRGEYENTTFVTFTARYQIVNHTSHPVCVAQHCLVVKSLPPFEDAGDQPVDGIIQLGPGSSMAFHWWRADADSLVSVRMVAHGCYWSGAFDINSPSSFHVNMRDASGGCHLLHVEIISIGPMNCVLLSDASSTPPPYRIDNFSEIPLLFNQQGTTADRLRTIVNPTSSMAYALDEPKLPPKLVLSIVGGAASTGVIYDLDVLGEGESMAYENFIFVELEGTNLVLDVAQDQRHVVFAPMQVGRRSQLWRMTSTGILQNEGVLATGNVRCVLDTEEHGIDPNRNVLLCLRQQDDRRKTPQTWIFTEDGRLTCVPTSTLGVHGGDQAAITGSSEVRDAFLGPSPSNRITRKRLRPGSGVLCVSVVSDGPTRVLRIADLRATRRSSRYSGLLQKVSDVSDNLSNSAGSNFKFQLYLPQGIGISLVSATEELAYVTLKHVAASYRRQPPHTESVRLSVTAIQVDNQLLSTPCLVLLFSDTRAKSSRRARRRTAGSSAELLQLTTSASASTISPGNTSPALVISASRLMNSLNSDVIVFKNLSASVSRLFIRLEERFLWKILQLFGVTGSDGNQPNLYADQSIERPSSSGGSGSHHQQAAQDSRFAPIIHRFSHIVLGRRLYFASLSIRLNRLDLGMATASAPLPYDLRRIKRAFRVPLIQFTGAQVELETFSRHHVLVTWPLLIAAIKQHYSRGFKSQAGKIFGSVDFLGSPLGLFTDVTEGLSGLIRDANVSGLVRHVMHGLSNSTARFTSAMSETLGSVASDVHYQAERDLIRAIGPSARATDHLVAGLVGFGHGVIGGVTSLFTHTYQGATQQGPIGLITGLGRGVVGTVTRPAAGFLDLAAGAAKAVSETARSSTAPRIMGRIREPRCTSSLTGALGEYINEMAEAQQFLFTLNSGRLNERLLAMECLVHSPLPGDEFYHEDRHMQHRVAVLVTSDRVYVVRRYADPNSVLQLRYDTIRSCRVVLVNGVHHVELLFSRNLTPSTLTSSDLSLLPPEMDAMALNTEQQRSGYLIRGTSEAAAQRITTMINCARQLHDRSRLFVAAAVLLSSSDSSSLLYGYSGCDFGNNDAAISEFDS